MDWPEGTEKTFGEEEVFLTEKDRQRSLMRAKQRRKMDLWQEKYGDPSKEQREKEEQYKNWQESLRQENIAYNRRIAADEFSKEQKKKFWLQKKKMQFEQMQKRKTQIAKAAAAKALWRTKNPQFYPFGESKLLSTEERSKIRWNKWKAQQRQKAALLERQKIRSFVGEERAKLLQQERLKKKPSLGLKIQKPWIKTQPKKSIVDRLIGIMEEAKRSKKDYSMAKFLEERGYF